MGGGDAISFIARVREMIEERRKRAVKW